MAESEEPTVTPAGSPTATTQCVVFTSADMPSLDQCVYFNPAFIAAVTRGTDDYARVWAHGEVYQVRETVLQVLNTLKWQW